MTLKIISSDSILFEGEASIVKLPGSLGEFTVLRNHAAIVSALTAGKIKYVEPGRESEGEQTVEIAGGVVDVADNIVSVCIY